MFRLQNLGREFVLVRASRPPYEWVLPKGHVEPGETPEETAHREVLEETGVDAELVAAVGDVALSFDGEDIRVRYFLMRMRGSVAEAEPRERRWCAPAEAASLLAFESSKAILQQALALLK